MKWKRTFATHDQFTLKELVLGGRGITTDLYCGHVIKEIESGALVPILKGWERQVWTMCVITRADKDMSDVEIRCFAQWLAQTAAREMPQRASEARRMVNAAFERAGRPRAVKLHSPSRHRDVKKGRILRGTSLKFFASSLFLLELEEVAHALPDAAGLALFGRGVLAGGARGLEKRPALGALKGFCRAVKVKGPCGRRDLIPQPERRDKSKVRRCSGAKVLVRLPATSPFSRSARMSPVVRT